MIIEEWQKGNESILSSLERAELHSIWLKEQHRLLNEKIEFDKPKPTETIVLGFID